MEIIVRKKNDQERRQNFFIDPRRITPSQLARMRISRENRQEYDNEKRAKELIRKMPDGHLHARTVAVAKMMSIDEHKAKKLVEKKSSGMVLDGKID